MKSVRGVTTSQPEPVETIVLGYRNPSHPMRTREFLDLPGTNRDKGIAHVPLKNKQELATASARPRSPTS